MYAIRSYYVLGWNPGTPQEIFSLEELAEAFTLDRVSKAGAKFDPDKTRWFQQQYLRNSSNATLAEMLSEQTEGKYPKEKLEKIAGLMKERATFVKDILSVITSYSIHYTKLYDVSRLPFESRSRLRDRNAGIVA